MSKRTYGHGQYEDLPRGQAIGLGILLTIVLALWVGAFLWWVIV